MTIFAFLPERQKILYPVHPVKKNTKTFRQDLQDLLDLLLFFSLPGRKRENIIRLRQKKGLTLHLLPMGRIVSLEEG